LKALEDSIEVVTDWKKPDPPNNGNFCFEFMLVTWLLEIGVFFTEMHAFSKSHAPFLTLGLGMLQESSLNQILEATNLKQAISFLQGLPILDCRWACRNDSFRESQSEPSNRVLVLGGSGVIIPILVQLLLPYAAHVAAVSSHHQLLSSLGVHDVVDYTVETKWWEKDE